MRRLQIGEILVLQLPAEVSYRNDTNNNCFIFQQVGWQHDLQLHLFQDVSPGSSEWCLQALEEHVRDVIGPPYTTNVQPVTDENWVGYQAVTSISNSDFLVNRIVVSTVSGYAARAEFRTTKDTLPEWILMILEDLQFVPAREP